MTLEKKWGL